MSIESLSDVIMTIYDTALAPDGWFNTLRQIADFSGSAGCRIVIDGASTGRFIFSVEHALNRKARVTGSRRRSDRLGVCTGPLAGRPADHPEQAGSQRVTTASGEPWQDHDEERVSDLLTVVLLIPAPAASFWKP